MSIAVEFDSRDEANEAREEHDDWICPVDDDRRFRTVHFVDGTPDDVLDVARHTVDEPDQVPEGSGLAPEDFEAGSDDSVRPTGSTGIVDPGSLASDDDAREAFESAEECRHAEGMCRNGDQPACEYLRSECGLDESETAELLDEREPASPDDPRSSEMEMQDASDDLTGQQRGVLSRSWGGYQGAVDNLRDALRRARSAAMNAHAASRAVNGVRSDAGQDPIHFDELEAANAALLDLLRVLSESCEECHADHSDHDHESTVDDREDLREFVAEGAASTPVGVSAQTADALRSVTDGDLDHVGGET